jgi:hypothetical protein
VAPAPTPHHGRAPTAVLRSQASFCRGLRQLPGYPSAVRFTAARFPLSRLAHCDACGGPASRPPHTLNNTSTDVGSIDPAVSKQFPSSHRRLPGSRRVLTTPFSHPVSTLIATPVNRPSATEPKQPTARIAPLAGGRSLGTLPSSSRQLLSGGRHRSDGRATDPASLSNRASATEPQQPTASGAIARMAPAHNARSQRPLAGPEAGRRLTRLCHAAAVPRCCCATLQPCHLERLCAPEAGRQLTTRLCTLLLCHAAAV